MAAITIPAVAPPERLDDWEGKGEEFGDVVEDARDAELDVSVTVVDDVDVEVGIDEGKICASSKASDVADGDAEEREEYVSFILASVAFANAFSGRAQQIFIWSVSR
jgi:hypothetical protein